MTVVAVGNKVKLHYTGTFDDGEVFDSSRDSDPFEFEVGAGQVIPGFDNAVVGMKIGESKKSALKRTKPTVHTVTIWFLMPTRISLKKV